MRCRCGRSERHPPPVFGRLLSTEGRQIGGGTTSQLHYFFNSNIIPSCPSGPHNKPSTPMLLCICVHACDTPLTLSFNATHPHSLITLWRNLTIPHRNGLHYNSQITMRDCLNWIKLGYSHSGSSIAFYRNTTASDMRHSPTTEWPKNPQKSRTFS